MEMRLWYWRRQVYNPQTGKVGWARAYKRNGVIHQYGPNGECNRTWELIGIWPTSLELGELSYDSADKKQLTMNLSVDFAYPGVRRVRVGRYGTADDGQINGTTSQGIQDRLGLNNGSDAGTAYYGNLGSASNVMASSQQTSFSYSPQSNSGI